MEIRPMKKKILVGLFSVLLTSVFLPLKTVVAEAKIHNFTIAQSDTIYVQRYLNFSDYPSPPKALWVEQGEYKGYIYQIGIGPTYYIYAGQIARGPYVPLKIVNSVE